MHTSRYQIIVSGRLGAAGRETFRDVLTRMRDLALDLIGFTCLAPAPDTRLAR
jgi:hypothetical protein